MLHGSGRARSIALFIGDRSPRQKTNSLNCGTVWFLVTSLQALITMPHMVAMALLREKAPSTAYFLGFRSTLPVIQRLGAHRELKRITRSIAQHSQPGSMAEQEVEEGWRCYARNRQGLIAMVVASPDYPPTAAWLAAGDLFHKFVRAHGTSCPEVERDCNLAKPLLKQALAESQVGATGAGLRTLCKGRSILLPLLIPVRARR